jgi:hypothetical protein
MGEALRLFARLALPPLRPSINVIAIALADKRKPSRTEYALSSDEPPTHRPEAAE